jgi:uncharacterized protein (TIGR03118 family)
MRNARSILLGRKVCRPKPLKVECLEGRMMLASAGFVEISLASNIPGAALHTDKDLINPWDLFQSKNGQFRIAANGAGNAPSLSAAGMEHGEPIFIPPPPGSPPDSQSAPTGNVANSTHDFVVSSGKKSAPAEVLFSTEDGTIAAWNHHVNGDNAVIVADQSGDGAVYKDLTMGSSHGHNFLYATNFHNGTIDVFDSTFHLVHLSGSFTDPNAAPPAIGQPGFAPFGIKNIHGTLFVTYALQDAEQHDDVHAAGNGFIDEFDTSGNFIKRFVSGTAVGGAVGQLNSPFGMTVAPDDYGPNDRFSGALLVGNFGDSHVSAFNIHTGAFLGQLSDSQGHPLTLNGGIGGSDTPGLWGITFGHGHDHEKALYFAAGVNDEADGLFGVVVMKDDHGDHVGRAITARAFAFSTPDLSPASHRDFAALQHHVEDSSAQMNAMLHVTASQSNALAFATTAASRAKLKATDLALSDFEADQVLMT